MTRFTFVIIWGLGLGLLISSTLGCKRTPTTRTIKASEINQLLDLANNEEASLEDKYNFLVGSYANLLQDANSRSDAEMLHLLRQYTYANEAGLKSMEIQFDDWQKNMTDEERMYFVINLLGNPSSRQIRELVPALRRRLSAYPQDKDNFERMLMRLDVRR